MVAAGFALGNLGYLKLLGSFIAPIQGLQAMNSSPLLVSSRSKILSELSTILAPFANLSFLILGLIP